MAGPTHPIPVAAIPSLVDQTCQQFRVELQARLESMQPMPTGTATGEAAATMQAEKNVYVVKNVIYAGQRAQKQHNGDKIEYNNRFDITVHVNLDVGRLACCYRRRLRQNPLRLYRKAKLLHSRKRGVRRMYWLAEP